MGPCKSGTRYSRPDAASTSNRGRNGKRLKSNNLEEYRSRSERLIASLVCCSKDPRDILWILRVKRKPIRTAQNDHVITRILGTTPLVGHSPLSLSRFPYACERSLVDLEQVTQYIRRNAPRIVENPLRVAFLRALLRSKY